MNSLFRNVNNRTRFAFRPSRTAKTRTGKPNSTTGDNNKNLTDKRKPSIKANSLTAKQSVDQDMLFLLRGWGYALGNVWINLD